MSLPLPHPHPSLLTSINSPRPHTTMHSYPANGATISTCFFSSLQHRRKVLLPPILRSSLSTQTKTQKKKEVPFIAEYFISSLGFSLDQALKASAYSVLSAIESPDQPDAVIKFLNDTGLSDSQIRCVVLFRPMLLGYDVDKTLRPKVHELMDAGFSGQLLVELIRYNPSVLLLKDNRSRMLFWRDFVGQDNEVLLKIIRRNTFLFTLDIDKQIVPKIELLKEYGMLHSDIVVLLQYGTPCMGQNLDSLRRTLELIEELGIPRGSPKKFQSGLKSIGSINEDTVRRKIEFFKKYGWSKEDMNLAFVKCSNILSFSEENLKLKMDFLVEEAGIDPRSIVSYPAIFGYSLEGVLMARYNVLTALRAKGLRIKRNLLSACHLSEKRFYESYVVPFEKAVPGLGQVYAASYDVKNRDRQLLLESGNKFSTSTHESARTDGGI